jgi:hypothetical protein
MMSLQFKRNYLSIWCSLCRVRTPHNVRLMSKDTEHMHMYVQKFPDMGYDAASQSFVLTEYTVKPGDFVEKDQVFATVEGDKVSFDIRADRCGFVGKLFVTPFESLKKPYDEIQEGHPIIAILARPYAVEPGVPEKTKMWLTTYHELIVNLHAGVHKITEAVLTAFETLVQAKADCPFPDSFLFWNYAQACYISANYDKAETLANTIAATPHMVSDVSRSRIDLMLGNIFFAMGRLQQAKLAYHDAIQHSPAEQSSVSILGGLAYYGLALVEQAQDADLAVIARCYGKVQESNLPLGKTFISCQYTAS